MQQSGTIGRRYARALAMALAGDSGSPDEKVLAQVEEEVSAVGTLLEKGNNPEFRHVMFNPSIAPAERAQVMSSIAKAHNFSEMTTRLLELLIDKDRIQYLPSIARAFRSEVDARIGRVRAQITSANQLDDAAIKEMVAALSKRVDKNVIPETSVDANLIGGVTARIGGLVFDNSVRTQLNRMRQELSA